MSEVSTEERAAQLGWSPLEEWKGDPEAWIDADEFVRRGESIMPLLRKNNERLSSQVSTLQSEVSRLNEMLARGQESMQAMRELQEQEIRRAVDRTRADLKAGIKQAREEGDFGAEEELRDQLTQTTEQLRILDEAKKVQGQTAPAVGQPIQVDEHTQAWLDENPWFRQDKRKTLLAVAIAEEFVREGRRPSKAYYADLDAELERVFPNPARTSSKVEGGSGSGRTATPPKGFASLPADAKAQCEADFSPKLVGEGRMFATKAEYQAHWAKLYNASEA